MTRLLEHHGLALLQSAGVAVAPYRAVGAPDGAVETARALGGRVVVKALVPAGGRGKAGAVRLADTPEAAGVAARDLLGRHVGHFPVAEVLVQTRYPGHALFAALVRHDYAAFANAQLAEREAAGFPPFVHEAALRAEAPKLAQALAFLEEAAKLVAAPEGVRIYDPVPHVITRLAGRERAQVVMQSSSRPALQDHLASLSSALFENTERGVRWHLDVDPIEFD